MRAVILIGLVISWCCVEGVRAETERRVRVHGMAESTVTGGEITLGSIATVSSSSIQDDDIVIALKKIPIQASPRPGATLEISGESVVERLRASGIDLNSIGYAFPKSISVKRAGTELSMSDVRSAVEAAIEKLGREIIVKNVRSERTVMVAPGEFEIEARRFWGSGPGQMMFDMAVKTPEAPEVSFNARVDYEEWKSVPVAARQLSRGSVLETTDIDRARVNLASLPRDAAFIESELLGHEIKSDIGLGEVFRKDKLVLPPVVAAGSKVTVIYKTPLLEASATGIALDSGADGEEIRVRNEASKKIVRATVLEKGMVAVTLDGQK